jgi:hypothetical protein
VLRLPAHTRTSTPSGAIMRHGPRNPAGLEYTDMAVTCYFVMTHGGQAAIWYSCVRPPRDLLCADSVLGEVDLRWPGVRLTRRHLG